jgi:hypothetical protein
MRRFKKMSPSLAVVLLFVIAAVIALAAISSWRVEEPSTWGPPVVSMSTATSIPTGGWWDALPTDSYPTAVSSSTPKP